MTTTSLLNMLPLDLLTDHIQPFLNPHDLFEFVQTWHHKDEMIMVVRWLFSHGLMDPYYISQSRWNLLSWACFHNHLKMIGLLLEIKVHLPSLTTSYDFFYKSSPATDFRMNALDIVCYNNRLDILKQLVVYDPSIIRPSNLHYAFEMDHTDMCEYLLRCGSLALTLDPSLFLPVCRHNNVRLFRLLKEKGCCLTSQYTSRRTLLMWACMQECPEIVAELLSHLPPDNINKQDDHGITALIGVCRPMSMSLHEKHRTSNQVVKLEIVKTLLQHGATMDLQTRTGATALTTAFQHHDYQIASYLLAMGADINTEDHKGWNALMSACHSGDEEAARSIVKHGIHLYHTNHDGMTALMFACRYKRHEIFLLLLRQWDGKQLNLQDRVGYTALMWACVNTPNLFMIRALVKRGADVALQTIHGSTAYQLAYEHGADEPTLAMLLP